MNNAETVDTIYCIDLIRLWIALAVFSGCGATSVLLLKLQTVRDRLFKTIL